MGLIKGALIVVGTVALAATGVAAGAGKLFFDIAGGNELTADVAELLGKGKDASFNAIRSMWDNVEKSESWDELDERQRDFSDITAPNAIREQTAKTAERAAAIAKKMALSSERNGDTEKYEYYVE